METGIIAAAAFTDIRRGQAAVPLVRVLPGAGDGVAGNGGNEVIGLVGVRRVLIVRHLLAPEVDRIGGLGNVVPLGKELQIRDGLCRLDIIGGPGAFGVGIPAAELIARTIGIAVIDLVAGSRQSLAHGLAAFHDDRGPVGHVAVFHVFVEADAAAGNDDRVIALVAGQGDGGFRDGGGAALGLRPAAEGVVIALGRQLDRAQVDGLLGDAPNDLHLDDAHNGGGAVAGFMVAGIIVEGGIVEVTGLGDDFDDLVGVRVTGRDRADVQHAAVGAVGEGQQGLARVALIIPADEAGGAALGEGRGGRLVQIVARLDLLGLDLGPIDIELEGIEIGLGLAHDLVDREAGGREADRPVHDRDMGRDLLSPRSAEVVDVHILIGAEGVVGQRDRDGRFGLPVLTGVAMLFIGVDRDVVRGDHLAAFGSGRIRFRGIGLQQLLAAGGAALRLHHDNGVLRQSAGNGRNSALGLDGRAGDEDDLFLFLLLFLGLDLIGQLRSLGGLDRRLGSLGGLRGLGRLRGLDRGGRNDLHQRDAVHTVQNDVDRRGVIDGLDVLQLGTQGAAADGVEGKAFALTQDGELVQHRLEGELAVLVGDLHRPGLEHLHRLGGGDGGTREGGLVLVGLVAAVSGDGSIAANRRGTEGALVALLLGVALLRLREGFFLGDLLGLLGLDFLGLDFLGLNFLGLVSSGFLVDLFGLLGLAGLLALRKLLRV